jgi:hypothetical protein
MVVLVRDGVDVRVEET